MDYQELVDRQRNYFLSGATRPYEYRRQALANLRSALERREDQLKEALQADLNKHPCESHITEIGLVYQELSLYERRLKGWMADRRVPTSHLLLPGTRSYISPEPYGVVLIAAPWNYPVNLSMLPLIGALAAGNCVTLKLSSRAPHTANVLSDLLGEIFPEEYVSVVTAAHTVCPDLADCSWDYIFYTGSKQGGRSVMEAAAAHFTPVTLELGGKNPVVVDPTTDIRLAARRIAYAKCLNAGQTCLAPDYLLIHESVRDEFMQYYREALKDFFPQDDMSQMGCIVDRENFDRLASYIVPEKTSIGGHTDQDRLFIAPAVIVDVLPSDPIMQREVFGPILPVVTWNELNRCVDYIRGYDKPLAMYIFSSDTTIVNFLMDRCSFGSACINDAIIQVGNGRLPFGGVGPSGMGRYHGKETFDTFTNYRSVADHCGRSEIKLRMFPYTKRRERLVKRFMK